MKIITGYTGEPHITSSQDRGANQGSYGTGSYVLDVGNKLAANTASANEIRLSDGVISHQGCVGIIEVGTYDPVTIENGAQGVNRIDLIVARYERNADTNVESLTIKVIKGTSTSGTPAAPTYSSGNIQSGASPVDMPLYQVRLTGITIASVTRVFSYVKTQAELTNDVSTLNSKLPIFANVTGTTTASGNLSTNIMIRDGNIYKHILSCIAYEPGTWNVKPDVSITPIQFSSNSLIYIGFQIKNIASPYTPVANTSLRISFSYIERT